MLAMSGLQNIHLDLGHVGIYRALSQQAGLSDVQEAELFDVLQRKARPELQELMADFSIDNEFKAMFLKLPELNGGKDVIAKAKAVLMTANGEVKQALAALEAIADKLTVSYPSLPISFDLAELRGYHYHTGVVFAAFVPSVGREIARGGRYDNIGAIFGRARPATGFSADLKVLSALGKAPCKKEQQTLIFAPYLEDAVLDQKIRDLRAEGQSVVQQLPGQVGTAQDLKCTFVLGQDLQNWVVRPLARLE
jgi:ATP phosphoribosyltransferase regulatory subunit